MEVGLLPEDKGYRLKELPLYGVIGQEHVLYLCELSPRDGGVGVAVDVTPNFLRGEQVLLLPLQPANLKLVPLDHLLQVLVFDTIVLQTPPPVVVLRQPDDRQQRGLLRLQLLEHRLPLLILLEHVVQLTQRQLQCVSFALYPLQQQSVAIHKGEHHVAGVQRRKHEARTA